LATHRSAVKRMRQNEKRRERNMHIKSRVKSRVKKLLQAVQSRDVEAAKGAFSAAVREINRARSRGVLHRNTASRKISRLARKFAVLSTH